MAELIDHLWQSILVTALIWSACALTAPNSALLRLWMWRIAALKFLLPFSLLYALGEWMGFPVRHSAIPPPASLQEAVSSMMHWAAPMSAFSPRGGALAGSTLLALALSVLGIFAITGGLRSTRRECTQEQARAAADAWLQPTPFGMLKTMTLAATTLGVLCAPVLAGALHDRVRRQEALAIDTAALREASITASETHWRFGDRTELVASADGVTIRRINLQDLVAMVYGIDRFEVFGGALPWLETPHYDVRVTGTVHSPRIFDPYSLREPVTRYLNDQYGVSIRVNGNCQEPCVNQESFVVERIPWTLSKMISGRK